MSKRIVSAGVFFFFSVTSPTAFGKIEMIQPLPLQRQAVDALRGTPASPYQTLEEKFENGKEPEDKVFKGGWRTGRCYFTDRPMQPVPALLTSDTMSDNGPAFTDWSNRKLIPLIDRKQRPDFFDKLSVETIKAINKTKTLHRDDVAPPVRTNATVVSSVPRTMDLQARHYEFRKADKHLIMRVVCGDHGGCFNVLQTWFLYYEGDTVAYCYFFGAPKKP